MKGKREKSTFTTLSRKVNKLLNITKMAADY
jgi:hypothetical protein